MDTCTYRTGAACADCQCTKTRCSHAQGRRRPWRTEAEHGAEAHKGESPFRLYELLLTNFTGGRLVWASAKAGSSKRQPSPVKLDKEESEEELVASKKGKGRQASRKVIGKTLVQRQRDQLAWQLNLLHSRLFQIHANVKALEAEHQEVMEELSDVVLGLEDLDL